MSCWRFSRQDPWKAMKELSWLSLRSGAELPFAKAPMSPAGNRKQGQGLACLLLHDGPTSDHESEVLLS